MILRPSKRKRREVTGTPTWKNFQSFVDCWLMQCLQKQLSTAKLERMLLPDVSIIHEIRSRNHCKRQECAQSEIHTKYPGKLYKCTCQCTTHIMPHQMPACIKIQESLKFAEHKSHPDFVQASFSIKNPMKLAINLNFCGSVQNEKVWPNPTNTSHQLPPQPILVPIMAAENYTTLRNLPSMPPSWHS